MNELSQVCTQIKRRPLARSRHLGSIGLLCWHIAEFKSAAQHLSTACSLPVIEQTFSSRPFAIKRGRLKCRLRLCALRQGCGSPQDVVVPRLKTNPGLLLQSCKGASSQVFTTWAASQIPIMGLQLFNSGSLRVIARPLFMGITNTNAPFRLLHFARLVLIKVEGKQ